TNSYSGGTRIEGGTLSISANGNLGHSSGGVTLDGGTLSTSAFLTLGRAVVLEAGGGTLDSDGHNIRVSGAVSGAGGLTKTGSGDMIVAGHMSHLGATEIAEGSLTLETGTLSAASAFTIA